MRVEGGPGKPQVFSDAENKALRAMLRRLKAERELTQVEVGRLLGISQQNAGRLLGSSPHVGMSRPTANALARALGYRDNEALLLAAGVHSSMATVPADHRFSNRDTAVRIARSMNYDEAVIQTVVSRYTAPDDLKKPLRWWNERFVDEDRLRRLDAADQVPPPTVAEVKRRTRKRPPPKDDTGTGHTEG